MTRMRNIKLRWVRSSEVTNPTSQVQLVNEKNKD
mgnify:CR=1 FL=1